VRLVDAGTGDEVAVGCRSGAGVRVRVVMSGSGPQSLDTVRVLLTGDLVRRVWGVARVQVFITVPGLDRCDPDTRRHLDSQLSRFWVDARTGHDGAIPCGGGQRVRCRGRSPPVRGCAIVRRTGTCVITAGGNRG
jgi:hypothetical protein